MAAGNEIWTPPRANVIIRAFTCLAGIFGRPAATDHPRKHTFRIPDVDSAALPPHLRRVELVTVNPAKAVLPTEHVGLATEENIALFKEVLKALEIANCYIKPDIYAKNMLIQIDNFLKLSKPKPPVKMYLQDVFYSHPEAGISQAPIFQFSRLVKSWEKAFEKCAENNDVKFSNLVKEFHDYAISVEAPARLRGAAALSFAASMVLVVRDDSVTPPLSTPVAEIGTTVLPTGLAHRRGVAPPTSIDPELRVRQNPLLSGTPLCFLAPQDNRHRPLSSQVEKELKVGR